MNPGIIHTAIIILAAGKSARLGSPKQLLSYNGKNLLRHAVDEALNTGCLSVYVVLGSDAEVLRHELDDKTVFIVENEGWEEGMASSIRCGLNQIKNGNLPLDNVIFMVCDQPYVSSSLLLSLVERSAATLKPIVACKYADIIGTPALFHKNFFPALMELTGDKGAGKFMADNLDKVATVQFPEGITDIDTKEDYESLIVIKK